MGNVLQDSTFQQLAEFIYQKTGIFIPPSKKYLVENRLGKLVEDYNLRGFDELLYTIRYSRNGREVDRLYDAITTNETYFFREPMQFDILVQNIATRVVGVRRKNRDIKIWSAACSSGDEPYTLAMVLRESRPDVRTEIIASDISTRALDSARRGVYTSYSVRNVPEGYLLRYFKRQGEDFALDRSIINAVRFRNFNLMEETRPSELADFDVIFCRNVLIYFDDKSKKKAVSFLYDSLKPGGFLFIGSSESLHNVTRAFRPMTINKVVVYEKR